MEKRKKEGKKEKWKVKDIRNESGKLTMEDKKEK
jgi:hypothetical protein